MATPETQPAVDANTWAETGDVSADGGDIAEGWASSPNKPSRQRFNWVLKKVHQWVRYLGHRGIPDYAATETYAVGDRVQNDGVTWRCIQANSPASAQEPGSTPTYWIKWGYSSTEIGSTAISGVGASVGAIANAVRIGAVGNACAISFRISSVPEDGGSGSATVTITLTSDAAASFASGIKGVQVMRRSSTGNFSDVTYADGGTAWQITLTFTGFVTGHYAAADVTLVGY